MNTLRKSHGILDLQRSPAPLHDRLALLLGHDCDIQHIDRLLAFSLQPAHQPSVKFDRPDLVGHLNFDRFEAFSLSIPGRCSILDRLAKRRILVDLTDWRFRDHGKEMERPFLGQIQRGEPFFHLGLVALGEFDVNPLSNLGDSAVKFLLQSARGRHRGVSLYAIDFAIRIRRIYTDSNELREFFVFDVLAAWHVFREQEMPSTST